MTGTAKQGNALELKSNAFALRMVRLYKCLREERNEFCLSKQVLRSGTSIGANVAESKYADCWGDGVCAGTLPGQASEVPEWRTSR